MVGVLFFAAASACSFSSTARTLGGIFIVLGDFLGNQHAQTVRDMLRLRVTVMSRSKMLTCQTNRLLYEACRFVSNGLKLESLYKLCRQIKSVILKK